MNKRFTIAIVLIVACLDCGADNPKETLSRMLHALDNKIQNINNQNITQQESKDKTVEKSNDDSTVKETGVKVRLTGSFKENIEMTVGNTGRKKIITSLPFEFRIPKNELPVQLSFNSSNYEYVTINVPKRPDDDIGHVYLLKSERSNVTMQSEINPTNSMIVVTSNITDQTNSAGSYSANNSSIGKNIETQGLDMSFDINVAPATNNSSDNTFAVIIANEDYEMASNVEMAKNDGLAMKEYMSKTYGLSDNQILYYPNATFGKINKAMKDLKDIAEAFNGDINLLFYYAGHGIPDNATKDAYLMPTDADGTDPSVCYSLKKLYSDIDAMNLNQAVVLLDACFSGAKRDGSMIVEARGVAIKPKEEVPLGNTIVISATSGEETAFSYKEQQHGLFTYFVLKHMQENKDKVTLGSLSKYIQENVGRQSILINGKKQTPTVEVPIALEGWENLKLSGK